MPLGRTALTVCLTGLVAAASVLAAAGEGLVLPADKAQGASRFLTAASDPPAALCALAHNPKQDFRPLRAVSPLPGLGVVQTIPQQGFCGPPTTAGRFATAPRPETALLSSHCLLTV